MIQESATLLLAEVKIQKHDIDGGTVHRLQRLRYSSTLMNDFETAGFIQTIRERLPEELMIIDQQESNRGLRTHLPLAPPRVSRLRETA
jgi:hypothetical protein